MIYMDIKETEVVENGKLNNQLNQRINQLTDQQTKDMTSILRNFVRSDNIPKFAIILYLKLIVITRLLPV